VIRASGTDAARFLHGQLTQDVQNLGPDEARLAGYCNAKGRLLATFVVWREGPQDLLLACSADLLEASMKRLAMFVLRAQCRLTDASGEWPLWGLVAEPGDSALPLPGQKRTSGDGHTWIGLPPALVDGTVVARAVRAGPAVAGEDALAPEAWRWLEVHSGVARVTAATREQFVPQMVNLEQVGGVDFQKGCYPGQEVVARSQYRGTLKRRACIVAAEAPLHAGQEIFHSADPGQPAGMVVLAGSLGERHAGLLELKLAALDGGTLHAGIAEGARLTPVPLPYPLPQPDAA
jgi:folate-binding protein YgfZ